VLGRFREAERFLWVQEEPENRGALRYLRLQLAERFPVVRFKFASRPASASPAVGSHRLHQQEQQALLEAALGPSGPAGRAASGTRHSASSRGKRS
jgi:2-oxoglutarate dehydrogenase E1 component